MRNVSKSIAIVGLFFSLAGTAGTTVGVVVTANEAAEIGSARWGGTDEKEMLNQPLPQALLKASRFALAGLALIGIGTVIQVVGIAIDAAEREEGLSHAQRVIILRVLSSRPGAASSRSLRPRRLRSPPLHSE